MDSKSSPLASSVASSTTSYGMHSVPPSPSSEFVFYTCYLNSSGNYNCVKGDALVHGKISRLIPVSSYWPACAHSLLIKAALVPAVKIA